MAWALPRVTRQPVTRGRHGRQPGAGVLQAGTLKIKQSPSWGDFEWERWILLLISAKAGVTFQPGYVGLSSHSLDTRVHLCWSS